jgi:hypothetical protein
MRKMVAIGVLALVTVVVIGSGIAGFRDAKTEVAQREASAQVAPSAVASRNMFDDLIPRRNVAKEHEQLKNQISSQLERCWRSRGSSGGAETPVATLRWDLKPDGSLDGEPTVIEPSQSAPQSRAAALAAIQAVKSCAPFALPPEQYAIWKTITWEFDPRAMQ